MNIRYGNKLLTLQKCLVRIVNGAPRLSHADPLFFSQDSLKIDDLYAQCVRIFSFRLYKNMLPNGISSIFAQIPHNHNTRAAKHNLYIQRSDPRSLKAIAPNHWNSLPTAIRQAPSIAAFKAMSKAALLAPYNEFSCQIPNCRSCNAQLKFGA